MDFALSEDERALEDAARAFAEVELAPYSATWDEASFFPVELVNERGVCGLKLPNESRSRFGEELLLACGG